jgi:hypothetical protein
MSEEAFREAVNHYYDGVNVSPSGATYCCACVEAKHPCALDDDDYDRTYLCPLHLAAPELLVMLEELQWCLPEGICPSCGGWSERPFESNFDFSRFGHRETCRLDALLRKAKG